jgi:integrase
VYQLVCVAQSAFRAAKANSWSCKDVFKNFQVMDRGKHRLGQGQKGYHCWVVVPPLIPPKPRKAKQRTGIAKMGVAIYTLRHSYATHRLEAGVNPRLMQRYLGHTQLETTMLYLHLTCKGQEEAYERLNTLMQDLLP